MATAILAQDPTPSSPVDLRVHVITDADIRAFVAALRSVTFAARMPPTQSSVANASACFGPPQLVIVEGPREYKIAIQVGSTACQNISQGADRNKVFNAIVEFAKRGKPFIFGKDGYAVPQSGHKLGKIGIGDLGVTRRADQVIFLLNPPQNDFGTLPASIMSDKTHPGIADMQIVMLHEIGHAHYIATTLGALDDQSSNQMALDYENTERRIRGYDNGNERRVH